MKRFAAIVLVALAAFAVVLGVRASRFTPRDVRVPPSPAFAALPGAAQRLASGVRIATVSPADSLRRDSLAFQAFHEFAATSFPRVHASMQRERVGRDALPYTWPGTDPKLPPVILMGHMDVVPIEPGTETKWEHAPFSGDIAEGYVWGRGTIDDKSTVLGIFEAAEGLITAGFKPRRTVLLAFGADEEVGGGSGAKKIAALLRGRGVRPQFVVDEGGAVIKGAAPGVPRPVAFIGVAEKGYVTVKVTAQAEGGHSSMPPRNTAAGILARAITRLESNPMPRGIRGATANLFDAIGPEMSFGMRIVFANRWLFDPLILQQLSSSPRTDATIRTTTAVTMLQGSPKDNVLPSRASAFVNFRILPGDKSSDVVAHIRKVVDDHRILIEPQDPIVEPSAVSPSTGPEWDILDRSIRQIYKDAAVAPYLVLGGTDSRYYRDLTPNVYRFAATRFDASELARVHGTGERISIKAYEEGINFLANLLQNAAR